MKTFNNIVQALQDIITKHQQLGPANYFFGEVYDWSDVTKVMPQIIIQPIPLTMNKTNIQYKFRLYYCDVVEADLTNLRDIYSDSIQILNDILNELEYHPNFTQDYYLDWNLTLNNFQEKFDELCAGNWVEISIDTPRNDSRCQNPINEF